jgi:uracil-DNA glycosylase
MSEAKREIQLEKGWKNHLAVEFEKDYMIQLKSFLAQQAKSKKTIYPLGKDIFSAFNEAPFEKTKVVIIGQDPYHGPDQAHGMCFSVRPEVRIPPSLKNIYKELETDLGIAQPNHGYLVDWAKQGILLLNSVLTVEQGRAASHKGMGWEIFTDRVIEVLNEEKENLVFLLWGSPAQKKGAKIDKEKHYILKCPHPSPLSSYRGFFGCRHFSQTNTYLESIGHLPIDWEISPN